MHIKKPTVQYAMDDLVGNGPGGASGYCSAAIQDACRLIGAEKRGLQMRWMTWRAICVCPWLQVWATLESKRTGPGSPRITRDLFQRALEADPNHAAAWHAWAAGAYTRALFSST
jgi:hypothetical protein